MNNLIKKIVVAAGCLCLSAVLLNVASANIFDITYPIPELGNCASQEECKIFCDDEQNQIACLDFAEGKQIIRKETAIQIREDLERFEREMEDFGPGGCITPRECDAYCRVLDNLDECLDYGVKNGHATQAEADEIREQADKGGPGGCKSREECDAYCKIPENTEECFAFVVGEGHLTQEEADFMAERMKGGEERHQQRKKPEIDEIKVSEILEAQGGPGGCLTIDECEIYCGDFSHSQECFEFAMKNGLMSDEEDIEMARKMSAVQSGPGGCMNDEECDAFCSQPKNQEECMNFMKKNGLMSAEEIMMIEREMEIRMKLDRGPGGPNVANGPGGCQTPEECDAYCRDPAHTEECINFAGGHSGIIDKNTIDDMMGQTREAKDKMRQMEEERMKFGPGGGMMDDGEMMDKEWMMDRMPMTEDMRHEMPPMDGPMMDMIDRMPMDEMPSDGMMMKERFEMMKKTEGGDYFDHEQFGQFEPRQEPYYGGDGGMMSPPPEYIEGKMPQFVPEPMMDMMEYAPPMDMDIMPMDKMPENMEYIPPMGDMPMDEMPLPSLPTTEMEQWLEPQPGAQISPLHLIGTMIAPFLKGFINY